MRIDTPTLDEAARAIADGQVSGAVHLCNAYTLALATKDQQLRAELETAALNLPDGMPLVWIARWLGFGHLRSRVYGPDLMVRTFDLGGDRITHYLLGSTPSTLSRLEAAISERWPHARIVGSEAPVQSANLDDFDEALDRASASGASVVWVGLGTPKQDYVATRLARRSPAAVVAIGAAFDFLAGTVAQSPPWMREHGLEWIYRLYREPRRLWRRYLLGNTRFVVENLRRRPVVEHS